jgi:heptosyltransferase III
LIDLFNKSPSKILVYRNGAIGDTIIALPSLNKLSNLFPSADIRILTAQYEATDKPMVEQVLEGSHLVSGFMYWNPKKSVYSSFKSIRRQTHKWKPDMFVYLVEARSLAVVIRDWLFFFSCGFRDMVGFPLLSKLRRLDANGSVQPHESQRLLDRINHGLGHPPSQPTESGAWDIVDNLRYAPSQDHNDFIVCSLGSKVRMKEWGHEKWMGLFKELSKTVSLPIRFVGDASQYEKVDEIGKQWPHGYTNLCGKLSIQQSMKAMKFAAFFVGSDSGPMHIAAALGVPCVAVFTARALPGVWFPYGPHHRVIYHHTECAGCGLEECIVEKRKCIESITVEEVLEAVIEVWTKVEGTRGTP